MRPPEVFVRELSPEEGARLKQISKRAKYQSKRQRAAILLASSVGMPAPQIAAVVRSDESHVRRVIHAFNERGFASFDPDYRGGRPRKTTPEQRDRIVSVARARPDTQGVALTRWSLPKLAHHLVGMGIELSAETVRQTLIAAGLSPDQRTRSWKWSPDPEFQAKAERVLGLYRNCPENGVVVCFDEMGPIQLIPHQGSGWATQKTTRAPAGDLQQEARGALPVRRLRRALRPPPRPDPPAQERPRGARLLPPDPDALPPEGPDLPDCRQPLRAQDARHRTWAAKNNVELDLHPDLRQLPRNRIECHFWAINEFVVNNADYPNWEMLRKAMADHIHYRNGPHRDERLLKAERRLLIAA